MVSQDKIQDALWRMATVAIDDFLVSREQIVAVAVNTSEDYAALATSLLSRHGLESAKSAHDIRFGPSGTWDGYVYDRGLPEYAACHNEINAELDACYDSMGYDYADVLAPIVLEASVHTLCRVRELLERRGASSVETYYCLEFHDVTSPNCFRAQLLVSERVNTPEVHKEVLNRLHLDLTPDAPERRVLEEFVNHRP